MKLWLDLTPRKKSVGRVDSKGKKEKESKLDQIGVDPSLIGKSLDFGHLVKRAVQVHGKSGKVFTRMQWVNPQDASTGFGMRRINSREEFLKAREHGIDKHPHFQASLQGQGIHNIMEHDWKKHPHFYLPETSESLENIKKRGVLSGGVMRNDDRQVTHMMHGMMDPDNKPLKEDHFVKQQSQEEKEFLHKYDMFPELHDYMDEIEDISKEWDNASVHKKIDDLAQIADHHWGTVKKLLKESINDDDEVPKHIKDIQHGTVDTISQGRHKFSLLASHPVVAKHAVETILGKELADDMRFKMSAGNLTINTSSRNLTDIVNDGYVAQNIESYLNMQGASEEDRELYSSLVDASRNGESQEELFIRMDQHRKRYSKSSDIESMKVASMWDSILSRSEAEYKALGLKFHQPKPVYLAYNPNGKPEGGGVMYGDGSSVKVDTSALKKCTANMNDTFYTSSGVPKVHDMDHLKDMFLLRAIHTGQIDDDYINGKSSKDYWLNTQDEMADDLPIELQYHGDAKPGDEFNRSYLPPSQVSVLRDVNHPVGSKDYTKTSEDIPMHTLYASHYDPDSWDEDQFQSDMGRLEGAYGQESIMEKAKDMGIAADSDDWDDVKQAIGSHLSMGDDFSMKDEDIKSDLPWGDNSDDEDEWEEMTNPFADHTSEKKSTSDFNLKKNIGLYINLGGK